MTQFELTAEQQVFENVKNINKRTLITTPRLQKFS